MCFKKLLALLKWHEKILLIKPNYIALPFQQKSIIKLHSYCISKKTLISSLIKTHYT